MDEDLVDEDSDAYRLEKAQHRLAIVDGLSLALENSAQILQIVESAEDRHDAHETLRAAFGASDLAAEYILDSRLAQYSKLGKLSIAEERQSLLDLIASLGG